jgi:hypothetical protein
MYATIHQNRPHPPLPAATHVIDTFRTTAENPTTTPSAPS